MRNLITSILLLFVGISLAGCAAAGHLASSDSSESTPPGELAENCPVTQPAWEKPPPDPAIQDPPGYGYYYVNEDRSIWAGAWWAEKEESALRVSEAGVKVGWFRPEGITLEITGKRIDGQAPPLAAEVPCCYPTRFQASGLIFPTAGRWEITARAGDSELAFVVDVYPPQASAAE